MNFKIKNLSLESIAEFEHKNQSDPITIHFIKSNEDSSRDLSYKTKKTILPVRGTVTYNYELKDSLVTMISYSWDTIFSEIPSASNKDLLKLRDSFIKKYEEISDELVKNFKKPWSEVGDITSGKTQYYEKDNIVIHHTLRFNTNNENLTPLKIREQEFVSPEHYIYTTIFYHYWNEP